MKINLKMTLFLISLLSFIPALAASGVPQGQEGHGGDIVTAMFKQGWRNIVPCVLSPTNSPTAPELREKVYAAFNSATLISVEKVIYKDVELDAVQFPKPDGSGVIIYLNRGRWLDPQMSEYYRSLIALHEVLLAAGYDDSSYRYSQNLTSAGAVRRCLKEQFGL
jgi:hypothetical protein